ncbi:sulfatase [Pseudonocardia zijingensis]|uniref:sulfatase n=1 Tax=Pseudonocardia zijingensis TaxID=153376 RepID=UPI0031E4139B
MTGTPPRPVAGRALTALAGVVVFGALLLPNDVDLITPAAFLGVPVEALFAATLVLAVPARIRPALAGLIGSGLGAVTVLKVLDMGFFATLNRPFDLLSDWRNLANAAIFVRQAAGEGGAIAAGVAAALLAVAVVALTSWAVARLVRCVVVPHRRAAIATIAVGTAVWTACLGAGARFVPDVELASDSTATLALYRALDVRRDVLDLGRFATEVPVDPFRATPDDQLLTALRGKDVVFAFVESYGRVALDDPQLGPPTRALLDDGTKQLEETGFASRSAYLTSSTTGAGSWLAHATFLSGLWIDSQHRHDALEHTDRQTLVTDFGRAGWRTVGVMPGVFLDWPEGAWYGYDRIYDFSQLGYQGPRMSFATMPDQYTLKAFEELERARTDRGPLMAEIPLVTSHAPWTPLPPFLPWDEVGDGSVYDFLDGQTEQPEAILTRDPARVREDYARSIRYSLTSLVSYVQTHGDDDLVVVLLGDHQPSPVVTGTTENREVPISIVAKDPAVLDRISGWRWQDGLRPGPHAPVWRMDAFRQELLQAFSDTVHGP